MELLMERCPWALGGVLLGLVVIGLQWLANYPVGMTGAFASWLEWLKKPSDGPSWRIYFFCGVVAGAFVFGRVTGFTPTFAHGGFDEIWGAALTGKALILVGAGVLVGFGTRLSGGCTSGHGLCGISRGSPAGMVSTMIFFGVAAAVAQILLRVGGAQ